MLDTALKRNPAAAVDRARALAARVELTAAMGDGDRARSAYEKLEPVTLTAEEREGLREALWLAAELVAG